MEGGQVTPLAHLPAPFPTFMAEWLVVNVQRDKGTQLFPVSG